MLGVLARPDGINLNSLSPRVVLNAVFCLSSGLTETCQYPLARSSVKKNCDPDKESSVSSIRNRGYESLTVRQFKSL